jgi:Tfp pilus assembly protein PilV
MNINGFSLVETLIYSTLVTIICISSFSWLSNSLQQIYLMNKKSKQVTMAHAVLQRLAMDIQMADAAKDRWHCNHNSFTLYSPTCQIRWCHEKDKIYRTENRSKSLMATSVTDFSCGLQSSEGKVHTADIKIGFGDMIFEKEVRVRNG